MSFRLKPMSLNNMFFMSFRLKPMSLNNMFFCHFVSKTYVLLSHTKAPPR